MREKLKTLFQSSGHYLLALLFAAVILLSALWTRNTQSPATSPAQMNQSQRLSSLTPSPVPVRFLPPAKGEVVLSFSEEPVHFAAHHRIRFHPSTHFALQQGEGVQAAFDGAVRWEGENLWLDGQAFSMCYAGVEKGNVKTGDRVKCGQNVGKATGTVYGEGENILCVTLYKEGQPCDLSLYLP